MKKRGLTEYPIQKDMAPKKSPEREFYEYVLSLLAKAGIKKNEVKKEQDKKPTFGEKLKEYREKRGLSQREVAQKTGVAPQYLNRLEKEMSIPRREIVLQISLALGLDFAERNDLLVSANYSPVEIEDILETRPGFGLFDDLLDDDLVPEEQKQLIREQIVLARARYQKT